MPFELAIDSPEGQGLQALVKRRAVKGWGNSVAISGGDRGAGLFIPDQTRR